MLSLMDFLRTLESAPELVVKHQLLAVKLKYLSVI